jgi:hypothetical protein
MRLRRRRRKNLSAGENLSRTYAKASDAQLSDGLTVVFADLSGDNGLSRAAIYDLAQIEKRHEKVVTIDIKSAISGQRSSGSVFAERVANVYFLCQPDMYQYVFPMMAPEAMENAYRIGRWVWETPNFPRAWSFASSLVHEVWAASEFSAEVFRQQSGIPIKVMKHAVLPPTASSTDMRRELGIDRKAFVGLAIMDIRSCPERKNPWAHVLAWKAAFGDNPEALLILKIRTSKRTRVVYHELLDLIGRSKNILLLDTQLSESELNSLQQSCDVFLSLHRSEGYGLNIHEALVCGKPVIATHWSANTEYGPQYPHYYSVRSRPIKYRDWTSHYEDNQFYWADPDISHAAELLLSIFTRSRLNRPSLVPTASEGGQVSNGRAATDDGN